VSTRLADAAPDLTQSFTRVNHFFNLLGYNQNGREGPENAARQEGYLFWVAWASHLGIQVFSSSDAHGFLRPTTLGAPCATLVQLLQAEPQLEFINGLTPLLTESEACKTGDEPLPIPALPDLPGLPDLPVKKGKG